MAEGMTEPDDDIVEEVLPLTPLQQGLLFHSLLDETGHDVYAMRFRVELTGPLDSARLRNAARELLARHANLRTGFLYEELDDPVQVVLREVTVPWSDVDLAGSPELGVALDAVAATDAATPFDLARPPLLRFSLVRLGVDRHMLLLTCNHLLLDGWSVPLLMRELLTLYATDDPSALPAPRPYRDFLAWLSTRDQDAARAVWREALAGVPGPTLLYPSAAGTRASAENSDLVPVRLDEETTQRLHQLAAAQRMTVNTVIQGLWAILLGVLTGRDDVVFGATVSGRPAELSGVESMIGLFINTVPVRMAIRREEPLRAALRRLQDEQSRLLDVQHVGLAEIHRLSGVDTLFDTLVVYENYPLDADSVTNATAGTGLSVGGWQATGATHYPLTLAVFAQAHGLTVHFEFRTDICARRDVLRLADRFTGLVNSLLADPDLPVGRLNVLTAGERDWLRDVGTGARPSTPRTLPETLTAQAELTPEATAVAGHGVRLSFADLEHRANQLARLLIERGAGPESIVALVLPHTPEMIVALAAVLKSGAAYLPLDPNWPVDRVTGMLADAAPVLLLTDRELARDSEIPTLVLDDPATRQAVEAQPGRPPEHRPAAEDPAYVIYTSGSTGAPKAVVVPHRAIANLLASHRATLFEPARRALGRPLRVANAWPTAFDASWQPLLWMFAGHELHLVPERMRFDPLALRDFLAEHRIEFVELSPSLLGELVEVDGWRADLRVLGVGGEAVPVALWRRLRSEDGLTVHNLYGPTECTVDATSCEVGRVEHPSIGGPVDGARLYILDRDLRRVPPGVEGELYIAGAGLARGYLGRSAETAARFVADPFTGEPGARMYRTGDVARWTRDGLVECLGRVDGQLKIRGFRVEPGEIEATLARHDSVARAAVVAREDRPGVRQLVAYVVPDGHVEPDRLRAYLADRLPEYLVPASVLPVPSFPLTHNGKLDVAKLPAPRLKPNAAAAPPRDALEKELAGVFCEVLGLDAVGVRDSFFALGGDSILSMRLVGRARARGLEISARHVFECRTVADLAEALRKGAM
jgi:amino acid adenylation domain-containing protein